MERLLPLLAELQNAAIRHRRMLAKAGRPNKEILRLQNAGITDLRQHDPDFANISRRLGSPAPSPLRFQDTGNLRASEQARQVPKTSPVKADNQPYRRRRAAQFSNAASRRSSRPRGPLYRRLLQQRTQCQKRDAQHIAERPILCRKRPATRSTETGYPIVLGNRHRGHKYAL